MSADKQVMTTVSARDGSAVVASIRDLGVLVPIVADDDSDASAREVTASSP